MSNNDNSLTRIEAIARKYMGHDPTKERLCIAAIGEVINQTRDWLQTIDFNSCTDAAGWLDEYWMQQSEQSKDYKRTYRGDR